jgi:hypothetical protein
VIIHAPESNLSGKSLKNGSYFSQTINKVKSLEYGISGFYVAPNNVLREMYRIAHRQFPWQSEHPSLRVLARYRAIYGHPRLADIASEVVGLTVDEIYTIGVALFGVYLECFSLPYPPAIELPGVSRRGLDAFLKHFSCNHQEMRKKLMAESVLNEQYSYTYHSLRAYPLLRMGHKDDETILCPLPTVLFWRMTDGVYYEIYDHKNFAVSYGNAFQTYVGSIIAKAQHDKRFTVYAEEEYTVGKNKKRTID